MAIHSVTHPILCRHCDPHSTFKSCNKRIPEAQTRWTGPLTELWVGGSLFARNTDPGAEPLPWN